MLRCPLSRTAAILAVATVVLTCGSSSVGACTSFCIRDESRIVLGMNTDWMVA